MPSQILYFSLPRSGCHMLERMLFSEQPNLGKCWHPHTDGVGEHGFAGGPMTEWLQQEKPGIEGGKAVVEEVEKGRKDWERELAEAQTEGRMMYMHDHAVYLFKPEIFLDIVTPPAPKPIALGNENPTTIPTALLLYPGTLPVFTIRNPLLTIPSAYLANTKVYGPRSRANSLVASHIGWNRYLHDFYAANGITAVVVDADEYMSSEDYVREVAKKVGLDPSKVVVKWEKLEEKDKDQMHPMLYQVQKTLVESEGLEKHRVRKNINPEAEIQKWSQRFTAQEVELFRELLAIELPYYEYLHAKRFMP